MLQPDGVIRYRGSRDGTPAGESGAYLAEFDKAEFPRLVSRLEADDFWGLKSQTDTGSSDAEHLTIRVVTDRGTHEVFEEWVSDKLRSCEHDIDEVVSKATGWRKLSKSAE